MINPLWLHRIAYRLYKWHIPKLPSAIQRFNYFLTHCDLAPTVLIGRHTRFQHFGSGVVVHHLVTIGNDVLVMPQVVIGQNVRGGTAVPLRRIFIGDHVVLGAGAKIIASGSLKIGRGAAVGANAVLLHSLPEGTTAVGVPARVIQKPIVSKAI